MILATHIVLIDASSKQKEIMPALHCRLLLRLILSSCSAKKEQRGMAQAKNYILAEVLVTDDQPEFLTKLNCKFLDIDDVQQKSGQEAQSPPVALQEVRLEAGAALL